MVNRDLIKLTHGNRLKNGFLIIIIVIILILDNNTIFQKESLRFRQSC